MTCGDMGTWRAGTGGELGPKYLGKTMIRFSDKKRAHTVPLTRPLHPIQCPLNTGVP